MVVTMPDTKEAKQHTYPKHRKASINPMFLPRQIPRWLTMRRATELLHRKDAKALGERAKRLHVSIRVHPYDKRKRQFNMPELLSRLDYDISVIKFTDGVDATEDTRNGTK